MSIIAKCKTQLKNLKSCSIDALGYCKTCNATRCGVHAVHGKCNRCRTELLPLRVFSSVEHLMTTLYPRSRQTA